MDGPSAKKSNSLETLVIQNITNVKELKNKLTEIIKTGPEYEYDVSNCLKSLLKNKDYEIVLLCVQAISELAKCDEKRATYAVKEVINPILSLLGKEFTQDGIELVKQCCRALGNLCCDCDAARNLILENNGVHILTSLVRTTLDNNTLNLKEIMLLACKTLLNYAIGGQVFSESIVQEGLIELLNKILLMELEKSEMCDDMVSTALLILSVITDNAPDFLFDNEINITVLNVLKETTSVAVSETCLEHLHIQAEHDTVKVLLAESGGVLAVCERLKRLSERRAAGDLADDDDQLTAVETQACELLVIVLTGDEAMQMLYNNGKGEVYLTIVKWLDSPNYNQLVTAVLALGNFARKDEYCVQMMEDNILDKLLDILEKYNGHAASARKEAEQAGGGGGAGGAGAATVSKVQHAVLSAVRNLCVPPRNKRAAAARGRAAPLLLDALDYVDDHLVAYKLLAAIRMLVDGQESVSRLLGGSSRALSRVCSWGAAGEFAGAAGEAPRLLAWTAKTLATDVTVFVQVEGCVPCLVNMLMASHSVMQNEAILALTLIAIQTLADQTPQGDRPTDYGVKYIEQLLKAEIGKHLSVLVETNCAKMPVEVAENLLSFLDITSKKNKLAINYKEAKVHESLQKILDSRKDFGDNLRSCIGNVVRAIAESG